MIILSKNVVLLIYNSLSKQQRILFSHASAPLELLVNFLALFLRSTSDATMSCHSLLSGVYHIRVLRYGVTLFHCVSVFPVMCYTYDFYNGNYLRFYFDIMHLIQNLIDGILNHINMMGVREVWLTYWNSWNCAFYGMHTECSL